MPGRSEVSFQRDQSYNRPGARAKQWTASFLQFSLPMSWAIPP